MARIERALGWRPTNFRRATQERGVSATAARWLVSNEASSAFVKIGATELTANWIRIEHRNYAALDGWFLPRVLGFDDDGVRPALALEDLSDAAWPPPWTVERVAGVLEALEAIATTPPPRQLLDVPIAWNASWHTVEADPAAFLALGLCSAAWLHRSLPALIAAAERATVAGTSVVHLDVRSDNLCFRHGRAILIDWNHAAVGNAKLDVAFWLPSLHSEGGPAPEQVLPGVPELAALVAGFFCGHAGGGPLPDAPHVRPLQLRQARVALPWAARELELEPPRPATG
jgi:hypothetical protein